MARVPIKYCTACKGKRLYRTEVQARDGLGGMLRTRDVTPRDASMHPYKCPHQRGWHFGHDHKVIDALNEKMKRTPCPEQKQ